MKKYLIGILLLVLSNYILAQPPWKLKKDFSLAFQDNYNNYRVIKQTKGSRDYYIGYDSVDTLRKLFSFETLPDSDLKEGWFSRFDSTNKQSFNIHFKKGVAKRLTYIDTDSLDISYYIDSNLLNGQHLTYYNRASIKEAGYYKNNARIGEWLFFNSAGKLISRGSYLGDYSKLLYDIKGHKLITLNRNPEFPGFYF